MNVIGVSKYSFPSTIPRNPNNLRKSDSPILPHRTIMAEIEIRVCVNRTCRRQGARETLDILSGIAPPNVSVNSCGCLSRCGAGPNLVILPQALLLSHCGTAARAAEVMASFSCGNLEDASKNLAALALRKKAEEDLEKGNFSEADVVLSQAVELKPSGGLHIIYKSRSSARLALGNSLGALEDANEALTIAPRYPQACLCQGDAFLAMEECDAAGKSYSFALQFDPSIRRSKSFKARIARLEEKLTAADMAS